VHQQGNNNSRSANRSERRLSGTQLTVHTVLIASFRWKEVEALDRSQSSIFRFGTIVPGLKHRRDGGIVVQNNEVKAHAVSVALSRQPEYTDSCLG